MYEKVDPHSEPTKIIVNPDSSTSILHLNRDIPDVVVTPSEDGKKLTVSGLYRPTKIQFSGDNVFWCTLVDAGPKIRIGKLDSYSTYLNLIKEVSEIETGLSLRERIAEYAWAVRESLGEIDDEDGYIVNPKELEYDDDNRHLAKTIERPFSTYTMYFKRRKMFDTVCAEWDEDHESCNRDKTDEKGRLIWESTGKYLYGYEVEVLLKRRTHEYISSPEPFDDNIAQYTGELWVVSLYGAEFVTKLYSYDGKRKWWFNPFSEDNHVIVGESVGGEEYSGRTYDAQSDPEYSEELDPALTPGAVSKLGAGICGKFILASKGGSGIEVLSTDYGEMYVVPNIVQTMFPSFLGLAVYQMDDGWNKVSSMDANLSYKGLPGLTPKRSNPIPWAWSMIGKFAVTNYPDSEAKLFVPPTLRSKYSLVYRSSVSRYTAFHGGLLCATIGAAAEERKDITIEIPDDIGDKKNEILEALKNTPYTPYTPRVDIVAGPGVLSDEQKLELYLARHQIGTIMPFDNATNDELMSMGGFWVTEDYIFIPPSIPANSYPTPERDSRFEKVYDPYSLELKFDEPIDVSKIEEIIQDMKNGKILRVKTRRLFKKTKDSSGRTVYADIPWDAAGFLEKLAERMEEESVLVSIIYPDDFEKIGSDIASDYPRYPHDKEYVPDGVTDKSDILAEAMQLVAEHDSRYIEASSGIEQFPVKHIAAIGLAMGIRGESEDWSVVLSDNNNEYVPDGASMTIKHDAEGYNVELYGDWERAGDPFENKYFVEYRPIVNEEGEVVVEYTAYDIEGNDITDQVISASFDDCLMLKE